ncbi:hypothetical protein MBLNU13_g11320t1 [Cladosporium sp. NU13]
MSSHSKVLLIGGGGIGVIAALSLEATSQSSVTIVLRSNYNVIDEKGYDITSCDHGELRGWRPTHGRFLLAAGSDSLMLIYLAVVNQVPHVTSGDIPFDYIVLATKNIPDHGPSMVDVISPAVTPGISTVVLIQNGLNIEMPYSARFPQNVILSGVSYAGSQEAQHGIIFHGSHDFLEIGAFSSSNLQDSHREAVAKRFVSLYAASGKATCQYVPHVQCCRWKKLVYNATTNPLCAITGLDTGSLRQAGPFVVKLLEDGMAEIVAVAAAAGHVFPEDFSQELSNMDLVEDGFEPSMLQDVIKVRKSRHPR